MKGYYKGYNKVVLHSRSIQQSYYWIVRLNLLLVICLPKPPLFYVFFSRRKYIFTKPKDEELNWAQTVTQQQK